MDKFRKVVADPYYAGVVMMDKQVKVYNRHGLHEPLISYEEYLRLIKIMESKPKYQIGPKRLGNPLFLLSNMIEDDICLEMKNKDRLVGTPSSNGKSPKIYKKYRCRSCGYSWTLDVMYEKMINFFQKYEMSDDTQKRIAKALRIVWQKDAERKTQNIYSAQKSILTLRTQIKQHVEDATDSTNVLIKDDILDMIKEKKSKIVALEEDVERLMNEEEDDRMEFMQFALSFIRETGEHFLEPYVSRDNRIRCKQMLFPGGIHIKDKEKVYTPELSVFFRGEATKKSAEALDNSHLVQPNRIYLNFFRLS